MNEKWRRLTVKSDVLKINDELTITVKGLSFKEMGHLAGFQDKRDFDGAMNYIVFSTLRKALPTEGPEAMTDEEITSVIDNLSGEVGFNIVQKVQELTGLGAGVKDSKN